MYSYTIDTTLLPTVFVTWASTKNGRFNKRYWLNCATGEKKDTPEDWMHYPDESNMNYWGSNDVNHVGLGWSTMKLDNIWVKSGTSVKYAYIKYHKDIDMLEVAAVGIDTTRQVEVHPWHYLGDRFFINRNKIVVNQHGNVCNSYTLFEYHTAYEFKNLLGMHMRLNYNEKLLNEFKKFIGSDSFVIGNGRCIQINYLWHLKEWYITSQKVKGKGKESLLVDKLTAIPLSSTDGFAEKYPRKESYDRPGYYNYYIDNIAYFERVDDDWSVIRILQRTRNDSTLSEPYRVYISDAGKVRIASHNKNEWITSSSVKLPWSNYLILVNQDEAVEKCNRIKYIVKTLDDADEKEYMNRLIMALRFPEAEQFYNLGCKKIARAILCTDTPKADMKMWFGDYYKEREKSLLRKIGLTKTQLDIYSKCLENEEYGWSDCYRGLSMMREHFGARFHSLDSETFEKYIIGFKNIAVAFYRNVNYYTRRFEIDEVRFTNNLIRLGTKHPTIYTMTRDALNTATYINQGTCPEIDWYFDDYSDAVRIHDVLVALKNAQDAERRAYYDKSEAERRKLEEEKRIKLDKERQKYEYEDDNYIIRLPKDSNEIVYEGSRQHICIGGYTTRHALGQTNLFFLRKKSSPDEPFYAIEMNHNNIIQIHGFGNKWLGNDPDAIPTVIRWLRKNDIKCTNEILTCTAKGYGATRTYVAMPTVD